MCGGLIVIFRVEMTTPSIAHALVTLCGAALAGEFASRWIHRLGGARDLPSTFTLPSLISSAVKGCLFGVALYALVQWEAPSTPPSHVHKL
jgi:hypothetical protein